MSAGVRNWKQTEERNVAPYVTRSTPLREHLQQASVGVYGVQGYNSASLRNIGQAWSWEYPSSLTGGC